MEEKIVLYDFGLTEKTNLNKIRDSLKELSDSYEMIVIDESIDDKFKKIYLSKISGIASQLRQIEQDILDRRTTATKGKRTVAIRTNSTYTYPIPRKNQRY